MADERLRDAYARAVRRQADPVRAACPSPDALHALARGEGTEGDRIAVLDHVFTCARCREDFELLRAVEAAGGHRPHVATWRQPRSWAAVGLAASLLLAIGLGSGRGLFDAAPRGDTLRGAADVVLVAPQDGASVSRAESLTVTWRPRAGVERYGYEFVTAEGKVWFASETSDTSVTIPTGRALPAGDYRWFVRAITPGGVEPRSDLRRLRVTE